MKTPAMIVIELTPFVSNRIIETPFIHQHDSGFIHTYAKGYSLQRKAIYLIRKLLYSSFFE